MGVFLGGYKNIEKTEGLRGFRGECLLVDVDARGGMYAIQLLAACAYLISATGLFLINSRDGVANGGKLCRDGVESRCGLPLPHAPVAAKECCIEA